MPKTLSCIHDHDDMGKMSVGYVIQLQTRKIGNSITDIQENTRAGLCYSRPGMRAIHAT